MDGLPRIVDVLQEIRVGEVRSLGATNIRSAIGKTPHNGPAAFGPLGVAGDQQGEPVIHGGPEKAVLHYAASHYDRWRMELPQSAEQLRPGGFGENLVSGKLDEGCVCIGDRLRIGGVVLQVAQPRQPCFKLNHRFGDAGMSVRAQETGRTGWYYRVLEAGEAEAGDAIELIERPCPTWPVTRVQHHLYAAAPDAGAWKELADLPFLSAAMRRLFTRRLATGSVEGWTSRLIDAHNAVSPLRAKP